MLGAAGTRQVIQHGERHRHKAHGRHNMARCLSALSAHA